MKTNVSRAVAVAFAFSLLTVFPLRAQAPSFSKYVALGDSYGAGFSSGCLVDRNQRFSYPNTLAHQLGITDFQQPTVSDPGLPTCTGLKSLVPVTFGPISTKTGTPTNLTLARSYDNLSVPGYKIADVSDKLSGDAADLVLRGKGSALAQALALNPTFITMGLVGNDILPAGGAALFLDRVTVTPLADFTSKYNSVAAALKASGRAGVFIGVPNARLIPLATTIPPVVVNPATNQPVLDPSGHPIPLLGPGDSAFPCPTGVTACPLPPGTLVTLGANAPVAALGKRSLLGVGFGIPCAVAPTLPQCGKPLPVGSFTPPATVNVGVVLYPDVVAQIDKRIQDMNAAAKAAADANGFKYFDFEALSEDLIANGRTYGGIHVSKDFVTGGMFAYGEAVHMSNIGYTIIADELIQFINASYGTTIERPNVATALTTPDVPAPGTTSITPLDTSLFFTEETWRGLFKEFPLQDESIRLVLPGESDAPVERAPVIRVGR